MAESGESASGAGLNPNAMTLANAARLLTRAGGQSITVEMLEADIAAGAPTNSDGTISLVHFASWLLKEMERAN